MLQDIQLSEKQVAVETSLAKAPAAPGGLERDHYQQLTTKPLLGISSVVIQKAQIANLI